MSVQVGFEYGKAFKSFSKIVFVGKVEPAPDGTRPVALFLKASRTSYSKYMICSYLF